MKDYNLERAWKDFKKRIDSGQLEEVKASEVKTTPIRSFGVEQGEYEVVDGVKIYVKLRSCWDFREANAYSD